MDIQWLKCSKPLHSHWQTEGIFAGRGHISEEPGGKRRAKVCAVPEVTFGKRTAVRKKGGEEGKQKDEN